MDKIVEKRSWFKIDVSSAWNERENFRNSASERVIYLKLQKVIENTTETAFSSWGAQKLYGIFKPIESVFWKQTNVDQSRNWRYNSSIKDENRNEF
jgi:hypothetical protein